MWQSFIILQEFCGAKEEQLAMLGVIIDKKFLEVFMLDFVAYVHYKKSIV